MQAHRYHGVGPNTAFAQVMSQPVRALVELAISQSLVATDQGNRIRSRRNLLFDQLVNTRCLHWIGRCVIPVVEQLSALGFGQKREL